ncbi:MAG: hypothetical protein JWQ21_1326 [Herminiimonas sp.]|nr:hypothetical protein [Herminiimonas sp.]
MAQFVNAAMVNIRNAGAAGWMSGMTRTQRAYEINTKQLRRDRMPQRRQFRHSYCS